MAPSGRYRITTFYLLVILTLCTGTCLSYSQGSLRKMAYSRRSPAAAKKWQQDLRRQLFELLRLRDLIKDHAQLPLQPHTVAEHDCTTYQLLEVEIQSTPSRRIPILLSKPKPALAVCPAVVCVHGHGGSRRTVYDRHSIYKGFAAELAAAGYVTIAADVGQHQVYEAGQTLMGERLWDLIRCVDFLCALEVVNPKSIGCAGLSLGGEMTMWLGAMDERISATVSSGFLTFMDQMEKNHCPCWKFAGLRERVDWPDIYSLIAPRPLQCQNGLKEPAQDFTVALAEKAIKEVQLIYQDFSHPEAAELQVHEGGHEIDLASLKRFFARTLGPH